MTYKILLFIVLLILSPFLVPIGASLYQYADPKQAIDYKVFRATDLPNDLKVTSEEIHVMSSFRGFMKFLIQDITIEQEFNDTLSVRQSKAYSNDPPKCPISTHNKTCSEGLSTKNRQYILSTEADSKHEYVELALQGTRINLVAAENSFTQAEWEHIMDSLQEVNPGDFKVFYYEPASI